ncbi:protein phosphatase [Hungatella hathewayi]
MEDIMTDKQFKTILEMFGMILDGCKDIEEAKEKVQKLLEEQKNKPTE